jgi:hypothetical protein
VFNKFGVDLLRTIHETFGGLCLPRSILLRHFLFFYYFLVFDYLFDLFVLSGSAVKETTSNGHHTYPTADTPSAPGH